MTDSDTMCCPQTLYTEHFLLRFIKFLQHRKAAGHFDKYARVCDLRRAAPERSSVTHNCPACLIKSCANDKITTHTHTFLHIFTPMTIFFGVVPFPPETSDYWGSLILCIHRSTKFLTVQFHGNWWSTSRVQWSTTTEAEKASDWP